MVKLTSREYDVLTRLHKTNKEIAQELGISEFTVRVIYYNLSGKFNANTRTAIMVKALKLGLVDLDAFIL